MDTVDLFERLGLALAIGLLIGVERGWEERKGAAGSRTAGIRTYPLIGLLGGVWGVLTPIVGPVALGLAALGFSGAFAFFQWREQVAKNDFSVTSVVVALLTFALGVYAVMGDTAAAAAAAVVVTALLSARRALHGFLRRLTWPELRSAIVLLAMTVVLLPLLPDRTIDPWDALNPHLLWLMIVLIGVTSFIGYVGVRVAGDKLGLLYAAAAGALVSSTAVTLNYSRLASKAKAGATAPLTTGIAAAWTVSLLRMTVLAAIIAPAVVQPLAPAVGAAAAVLLLASLFFYEKAGERGNGSHLDLDNPFEPIVMLRYGALLVAIVFISKLLTQSYGQQGLLPLAAFSGLADVDPITLATAKMVGAELTSAQAALAILVAAAANLVIRMGLAFWLGGPRFGMPLAAAGVLAFAAGAGAYAAQHGMFW